MRRTTGIAPSPYVVMRARRATSDDVPPICRICADGWRHTYRGLRSDEEIERVIARFYVPERVSRELDADPPGWGGWWVAVADDGAVVAAGAGGLTAAGTGELFVLYADPARRGEGAGTALLDAISAQQVEFGATEQWVSVGVGNTKGIPFYEARGFVARGTQPAYELSGESLRYRRSLPRHSRGKPRAS